MAVLVCVKVRTLVTLNPGEHNSGCQQFSGRTRSNSYMQ